MTEIVNFQYGKIDKTVKKHKLSATLTSSCWQSCGEHTKDGELTKLYSTYTYTEVG